MKHTLLIADDDSLILNTLKRKFAEMPGEVFTAGTVNQALDVLGKVKPDLILTDVMFEGQPGATQILDYVKSKPEMQNVPIIIFTNLESEEIKKTLQAKGVNEYFTKGSFSLDQLYEKVMSYLDR